MENKKSVSHSMSLYPEGFDMIRSGTKTVEVRLYDEKRRKLRTGDRLTFEKLPERTETIETEIIDIKTFPTFEELYRELGFEPLGRADKTMNWMLEKTRELYSKELEEKHGAVAIYIKAI